MLTTLLGLVLADTGGAVALWWLAQVVHDIEEEA